MVKVSSLIIGMLLIGMIASVYGVWFADLNDKYGSNDYDSANESLQVYNKLSDLHTTTQALQNRTLGIKENPTFTDKIGMYIGQAFDTLKIAFQSYDTFDTMADQGIQDANIGQTGTIIKTTLSMIVLISLLFLFISAIMKWNL